MPVKLSLAKARAAWSRNTGLAHDGRPRALPPEQALRAAGWLRTLGGVDVYLALLARTPGLRRAKVDAAIERAEIKVVPAVRGCIYLVPWDEVPATMRLAAQLARARTAKDLKKVGSSWKAIHDLAELTYTALLQGPLTTQALRRSLPPGAVQSYGAAGKKIGLSSPLPLALRELEFDGWIERLPVHNRLDSEQYTWRIAPEEVVIDLPSDPAGLLAEVIERVLAFAAPITVKELSAFTGFPQREVKAALDRLETIEVTIEGHADSAIARADQQASLMAAQPTDDTPHFLPFEDIYLTMHGGTGAITDPAHHDIVVEQWGNAKSATLKEARHLHRRAIVHRGTLIGFWEFDPDRRRVAYATFEKSSTSLTRQLDEQSNAVTDFLVREVGHGRAFSLDTDEDLRRRVKRLA